MKRTIGLLTLMVVCSTVGLQGMLAGNADLSLALRGDTVHRPGEVVVFHVDVANAGPEVAENVVVRSELTLSSDSGAGVVIDTNSPGWSCERDPGALIVLICTRTTLPVGDRAELALNVQLPGELEGPRVFLSAVAQSDLDDPNPDDDADFIHTSVISSAADLSVSVGSDGTFAQPRGAVRYLFALENLGPDEAHNVTVFVELAGHAGPLAASGQGWQCQSADGVEGALACQRDTLPVGPAPGLVLEAQAPAALDEAEAFGVSLFAAADTYDPYLVNDTADFGLPFYPQHTDLSLSLELDAEVALVDKPLGYAVSIENLGPDPAINVAVVSELPSGSQLLEAAGEGWQCGLTEDGVEAVRCLRDHLAVGAAARIDIALSPAAARDDGILVISALASNDLPDVDPNNDVQFQVLDVVSQHADLSLSQFSPGTVLAGTPLSYTLLVENTGPHPAESITVTADFPADLSLESIQAPGWTCAPDAGESVLFVSCLRDALAVGEIGELTLRLHTSGVAAAEAVSYFASVFSETLDPDGANNVLSAQTSLAQAGADLSLRHHSGADAAVPGQRLAYTLAAHNQGPDAASNVLVLIEALDAAEVEASGEGWSCQAQVDSLACVRGQLSVGETSQLQLDVQVAQSPETGELALRTSITSDVFDPDTGNNIVQRFAQLLDEIAGLSVTVDMDALIVRPGERLEYVLQIQNQGPDAAENVVLKSVLPHWAIVVNADGEGWQCQTLEAAEQQIVQCNRAQLGAGETVSINVSVQLPERGGDDTLVNLIYVSNDVYDPNPLDNAATHLAQVLR